MRTLTILGSTGTIGVNTLDVVARHPMRFRVFALAAQRNDELLARQCARFRPRRAVLVDDQAAQRCRTRLRAEGIDCEILSGAAALEEVARTDEVDTVMAAIVGAAGLKPTLAAACAGKRVLLANKEALVMSGAILMQAARSARAELLPVDSEHNAVFQSLPGEFAGGFGARGVRKIVLTASGGPFRTFAADALADVTPEQACRHPNWVMGRKISVDSATMMNKALEVIEACWLFDAKPEQVQVVVHPQSIVHAMVFYLDGSVIAQLSQPDMRTPIAYALAYPERIEAGVADLDLPQLGELTFEPLDRARFPCVDLAYQALARGGTSTAILNAANEIAVEAFLGGRLPFTEIAQLVGRTLREVPAQAGTSLDEVIASDTTARAFAQAEVERVGRSSARAVLGVPR